MLHITEGRLMAQNNPYELVLVESFIPNEKSGKHGKVHIRPAIESGYSTDLQVECSKALIRDFPVGTKFRLQVKLTDRKGGGEYLYSSFRWKFEVVQ
jgi:hypothetical protein